ncbi:MAG: leucyl aminopeptidase [Ponticaulis sp.]|nr:leucyl aminopeptidase [Ponticaulis sp.]|tara:strand:+ start:55762 stop:57225 length:1464 start_codon:yes stop_codon:yes gene_type:complete
MNFEIKDSPSAQVLIVLATEDNSIPTSLNDVEAGLSDKLTKAAEASRFRGKSGQSLSYITNGDEPAKIIVIGAGKLDGDTARALEEFGGQAVKQTLTSGYTSIAIMGVGGADDARILLGARLAAYRFDKYMTKLTDDQKPSLETVSLVTSVSDSVTALWKELEAAAAGTEMARDLMNEPPNVLYPESYADRIKEMEALGIKVTVLGEDEMTKLGMNSLLGVGQGSVRESQMAIMEWNGGGDEAPLALVGKGVCFDTGGISLKPGPNMQDMKGDMGGSAAVVGAMKTLAMRKAKANVVGLVGLVENMPDGNASRPGDIVYTMSGQTVENQNTDAEGRLVLCDVLWYAQETYKPKAIIDLATLTGAIIVSLGHENAGVFSNDDALADQLISSGVAEGETCWRLPLSPAYDKLLKSQFADMKNIGGPAAGSITAAQFLKRFIKDGTPWAHIDIAGVAWKTGDKSAIDPSWASGFGPRLLDRLVKDHYEVG